MKCLFSLKGGEWFSFLLYQKDREALNFFDKLLHFRTEMVYFRLDFLSFLTWSVLHYQKMASNFVFQERVDV
jgi:hypothetical protein